MTVQNLMTNRVVNPLGRALPRVRLSYTVEAEGDKAQAAARVTVARDAGMQSIVFDSGRDAGISSLCFVPELSLEPRTRYFWRVEVWGDAGGHAVSDVAWFETGKRDEPWQAQWIGADLPDNQNMFKDIELTKPVRSARAYACGVGLYELYVNGEKAGDEFLAPHYNAYDQWLQVQTLDVTDCLRQGTNRVLAMLGDGWYKGRFGFRGQTALYGEQQAFLMELRVTYADGEEACFATDLSWLAEESRVRFANIYDGEVYDATFEPSGTHPVCAVDLGYDRLTDRLSLPVVITERIAPKEILTTPAGETVLDLGQEITGWLEFTTSAPRGTRLHLMYGEILQHGNFYNENLRSAKAEFTYICDGSKAVMRPRFTFYGFRYVKLEGFEGAKLSDFSGCVVHSELQRSGWLATDHDKVNRLILNALWGQRGNFLDVPTDCPQRDERMGWTGDAQAFSGTACFNMDCAAFFEKYLHDMRLEQVKLDGAIPHVVPKVGLPGEASCAWADAATIIPWTVYTFYGDRQLLSGQYPLMRDWADWLYRNDEAHGATRLWQNGFHFADWLALDGLTKSSFGGTDPYFVASAFYFYSVCLAGKAAAALGLSEDAARWEALRDEIFEALQREYFTPTGRLAESTQTAYVCALYMGFAKPEQRQRVADLLKVKLDQAGGELRTGFVGTSYLLRVLSENGLNDDAYRLLLREEYPGWLYEVNMGATTVWERWNSVLPNGLISDTGMNSLNHYAYGAVVEWMYRNMAGLQPCEDAPGFKRARVRPQPNARMRKVSARYASAAGTYAVAWEILPDGQFDLKVTVPFDAKAECVLPGGAPDGDRTVTLEAGEHVFRYMPSTPLAVAEAK